MALDSDDIERIRRDFPILDQEIAGKPLVYLDNGATTQVPNQVLDAIVQHYHHDNANVHRGIHTLSERSTAALEAARKTVAAYLHAADASEVAFTRGATSALNMLAGSVERSGLVGAGDVVAVTMLEHHANFVPWQQLCKRTGARFQVGALATNGATSMSRGSRSCWNASR